MYLVAIKSLYSQIGEGQIAIVDDGSLTPDDRDCLDVHLGGPDIVDLTDIPTGRCPRGGTWERLVAVLDRSQSHYVIQVDSDTLTRDRIPEVIEAYRQNRSFTLGTPDGAEFVPLAQAAAFAAAHPSNHIQIVAERQLGAFAGEPWRYVRGCAGFAGFARGQFDPADAETWSVRLQDRIGGRWAEWGSEQVTSNLLIANAPNGLVLPLSRYTNFEPATDPRSFAFIHFIGTYRYVGGVYTVECRRQIAALQRTSRQTGREWSSSPGVH